MTRLLVYLPILAACLLLGPASARALVVAGWDFSQFEGDGSLAISPGNFVNTLSANYSNLDPTFNAGAESAAFGTLYFDGQFGSSEVDAGSFDEEFLPTAGSLGQNLTAPVQGPGDNPFDSFIPLQIEGQVFRQSLSMIAVRPVSVVFEADLSSVLGLGTDWELTFGGRTFAGTSTLGVAVSLDGSAFEAAGSALLSASEQRVVIPLTGVGEVDRLFVQLNFTPVGINQPIIDNVAIEAANVTFIPEPSTLLLVSTGLVGLLASGRRSR
jgi:hypothetical protein